MRLIQSILIICITAYSLLSNSERDIGPRPVLDKAKVAELIVYYTNVERIQRGFSILENNPVLASGAEIHSKYMYDNSIMSHFESKLSRPEDRVKEACKNFDGNCFMQFRSTPKTEYGYTLLCCGENIITSFANNSANVSYFTNEDEKGKYKDWVKPVHWFSEDELARDLVLRWMNSPGHRSNILKPDYGAMGAAISDYSEKMENYYGTQVFSPTASGGIITKPMKFDPILMEGANFNTTLDSEEVLEKYTLILTKLSGEADFSYSKKGKLYPIQVGNLKSESIILIEILDKTQTNIRYPYWKFKLIPTDIIPKIEWVSW